IKISPVYLSTDDLSKLWTAMQARYRPSMAYVVTVVLIQHAPDGKAALPVLQRGTPVAHGGAPPVLISARPAVSDLLPAIRLGDDGLLSGLRMDYPGIASAIFEDDADGVTQTLTPTLGPLNTQLMCHVPSTVEDPNAMTGWVIGVYEISLKVNRPASASWT